MRCPPMAPLLPPIVTNGDTGISRFEAAGGRTSHVRPTSYYIRRSTCLKGRAVNWRHSRQRLGASSRRHDRSGNRICTANRELYAFFIMQKCYGLEGRRGRHFELMTSVRSHGPPACSELGSFPIRGLFQTEVATSAGRKMIELSIQEAQPSSKQDATFQFCRECQFQTR